MWKGFINGKEKQKTLSAGWSSFHTLDISWRKFHKQWANLFGSGIIVIFLKSPLYDFKHRNTHMQYLHSKIIITNKFIQLSVGSKLYYIGVGAHVYILSSNIVYNIWRTCVLVYNEKKTKSFRHKDEWVSLFICSYSNMSLARL